MAKQTNYFTHDSNARNDDKIIALRMRLGAEGYGIYFMVLERLRESSDYMSVTDYNVIAFDLRVSSEKIKSVVEEFGLFVFTDDGKHFYSESFLNRMSMKDEKSEKAKMAAEKRWKNGNFKTVENQQINAIAMRTHNSGNADAMPISKESKERKKECDSHAHAGGDPGIQETRASDWFAYPIDGVIDELRRSTVWKESVCMQYRITPEDADGWIAGFAGHLKSSGEESKTIRDAKKHFSSWLRIQLDKSTQGKKQTASQSDNSWRFDPGNRPQFDGDWHWIEQLKRWVNAANMSNTEKRRVGLL